MKEIMNFVEELRGKISLDFNSLINKNGKIFSYKKDMVPNFQKDFLYAGLYLGKIKEGKLHPSTTLLSIIAKKAANKVILDNKASWLFICGRDIFRNRILRVEGSKQKGNRTLILNNFGDCLGYGKIIVNLDKKSKMDEVVIKNIFDIGDFLRRER